MSGSGYINSGSRSAHRLDDPNKIRTKDVINSDNENKQFSDLHFPEKILTGLASAGFLRPSPVQWAALPLAKIGVDLIVQSKSGTGKTLVYVVTALNMIDTSVSTVQAVVLTPTREIAVQGARISLDIAAVSMPDLKVSTLIGGMSVRDDVIKLKRCHMIVGTPGRVRQLIEEKYFKTDAIRFFALDEADKMLESSFKNDVTCIYNSLPAVKQVMALSATYPESMATTLTALMRTPKHVRLDATSQVLVGLDQYVLHTNYHPKPKYQLDLKFGVLLDVLNSVTFSQCLIFTNYSLSAQTICERLNGNGWPAIFIAATLQDQYERLQALNSLRQFTTRIMVTTDLSARGVDAANVTLVVNFDVPWDSRTFLHRSGRAGRFGSRGINLSLASEGEESDMLRRIVFRTGTKIRVVPYETLQLVDEKGGKKSESSEYELPDFWKIETDQIKEVIEKYPLVEGLECPFEEFEDKPKVEKTENDIEEKEPGKKKKRANRRKKKKALGNDSEIHEPTDRLVNCSVDEAKISRNVENDYNENEYYAYNNDENLLYKDGEYNDYEYGDDYDYEDGEYYDGEYEDYYDENYYGAEEGSTTYEQCVEGQNTIAWQPVHSKIVPNEKCETDDLCTEYTGENDQFIIEQYALATGFVPSKSSQGNIENSKISNETEFKYEQAKLLLSDFLKENLTKKTDKRFEKLLTYKEIKTITDQFMKKEENLIPSPILAQNSKKKESPVPSNFDGESLVHAANTIQKYEQKTYEKKVQNISEQIKDCNLSTSEIIDEILQGKNISEIVSRSTEATYLDSELSLETSKEAIGHSTNPIDAISSNGITDAKADKVSNQLGDIFSVPKSSNNPQSNNPTSKSKPTSKNAELNKNSEFGDIGPDGLPKWIPVEMEETIINKIVSNEDPSYQKLEVFKQGKRSILH